MSTSPSLPTITTAGASPDAPAFGRSTATNAQIWAGLWTIYVVWGSTYLAIAFMVETMPALLGGGVRFVIAGAAMLVVLALRGRRVRLSRAELRSAAFVGTALMGANGIVCIAEKEVPSGLAALLIASIPLLVIVLRVLGGERPHKRSIAAVCVGFAGVALLLLPGEQTGGASLIALLACVFAAMMWAVGSYASPKVSLPRDPLVSTGWQMLLGGTACVVAALLIGEGSEVHLDRFSTESWLAFAYLISIGSWFAFSAYAWLLQNAPVSKVATYAYVNPVIAIALGALLNDEAVTGMTVIGAAIIVVSVALVVRTESRTAARTASRARSASASV